MVHIYTAQMGEWLLLQGFVFPLFLVFFLSFFAPFFLLLSTIRSCFGCIIRFPCDTSRLLKDLSLSCSTFAHRYYTGSSFPVFFFAFPTVLLAGCLVVAGVDNGFSPIVGLRVALSWSCQHQALGLHCSIH